MATDAYKVRRILDILREPPKVGVPVALVGWLAAGVAAWDKLSAGVQAESLLAAYEPGASAKRVEQVVVRLSAPATAEKAVL